MKANKRMERYSFISRVAAVLLTISMLFQIEWPLFAMAESDDSTDSFSLAVHVFFEDAEIYDDVEINPTGYLYARYIFAATRSELANGERSMVLPKSLIAAYAGSQQITGTDSKGKIFEVGELTIDDESNVKVSFLDLLVKAAQREETNNGVLILGDTQSGGAGGSAGPAEDTQPGGGEIIPPEDIQPGDEDEELAAPGDALPNGGEEEGGGLIEAVDAQPDGDEDTDSASSEPEDEQSDDAGDEVRVLAAFADVQSDGEGGEPADPADAYSDDEDNEAGKLAGLADIDFDDKEGEDNEGDKSAVFADSDSDEDGEGAEIDPDELITVVFDVPVAIDTTGLDANDDGSFVVELESGGKTVTIVLLPAPGVAVQAPAMLNARIDPGVTNYFADIVTLSPYVAPGPGFPPPTDSDALGINLYLYSSESEEYTLLNGVGSRNVSSSSMFRLSYDFVITKEQAQAIYTAVVAGNGSFKATIMIPDGLQASPVSIVEVLEIDIPTIGKIVYGTLQIDSRGNAAVIFEGKFWESDPTYYWEIIENFKAHIDFGCKLDMADIQSDESYRIILRDNTTIDLDIEDNNKADDLKKTGQFDANTGIITWTVTYTAGTHRHLPITFSDVFDKAGEFEFVSGYGLVVRYNNRTLNVAAGDITITRDEEDETNGFSYEISFEDAAFFGMPGIYDDQSAPEEYYINSQDKITFTYQTHVTDATFKEDIDTKIYNTATVTPDASAPVSQTEYVTVTQDDKKWIPEKTYTMIDGNEITWTVKVKVRDTVVDKLTFYDYIDEAIDTINSVKVKPDNAAEISLTKDAFEDGYEIKMDVANAAYDVEIGDRVLAFDLPQISDGDGGSVYDSEYTVTYTATIKNDKFAGTGNDGDTATISSPVIDNIAWLAVTWPGDQDPTTGSQYTIHVKTNGKGIGPGIDTHIIQKSGTVSTVTPQPPATGPKEYYINWTITVNRFNLLEITGGEITDTLDSNLKYVPGTLVIQRGNETVFSGPDGSGTTKGDGKAYFNNSTSGPFSYVLPNGGSTDRITITFKTRIDESLLSGPVTTSGSANATVTFYNKAVFDGTINYGGSTTYPVNDYAEARPTTNSSVVNKTVKSAFDYSTHKITWMVEVNRNKITMLGDVELEDTFGSWLGDIKEVKVCTDSAGNSESSEFVTAKANAEAAEIDLIDWLNDTKTLKITLPGTGDDDEANPICSGKTVYVFITALIDVNEMPALKKTSSATFSLGSNTVTIKWHNDKNVEKTSKSTISSGSVSNNNMLSKAADKTNYGNSNNVIKYQIRVNPVGLLLDECKLTDVIPSQLSLNVDTVKLYKASVSPNGSSMSIDGAALANIAINYDGDAKILEVELPDTTFAYILEYSCEVLAYGFISNNITLSGNTMNDNITKENTISIDYHAWAVGNLYSKAASIKLVKVNEMDGSSPIPGITFKLYTKVIDINGAVEHAEFLGQTKTTDINGIITFSGLVQSDYIEYRLEELESTTGYDHDTATVIMTTDGEPELPTLDENRFKVMDGVGQFELTITNLPKRMPVQFTKINNYGERLVGSTFTLTHELTGYTLEATAPSNLMFL